VTDSTGNIQYVSKSDGPVLDELRFCLEAYGSEKVHSVRLQSFSSSNKMAIDAYRGELLKQIKPRLPLPDAAAASPAVSNVSAATLESNPLSEVRANIPLTDYP